MARKLMPIYREGDTIRRYPVAWVPVEDDGQGHLIVTGPAKPARSVGPTRRRAPGRPKPKTDAERAEEQATAITGIRPEAKRTTKDPLGGWGVLPGRGRASKDAQRQRSAAQRNRAIDARSVFNNPKRRAGTQGG